MTDYKITVPPYIEHIKGIPQVCNGWKTPRKRYGKRLIRRIERAYPQQQQWIRNYCENHNEHYSNLWFGMRCKNINDTIIRMESANQRKLRKLGLKKAIRNALIDCASSDYYYMFEKDWG